MDSLWTAIAVAIVGAVLIALGRPRQSNGRPTQWPPAPPTLPIIGNMHQILKGGDAIHIAITKLAKVHGPLMTLWFGSRVPTIIVSGHDLVWEVLVSKSSDYADRNIPTLVKIISADWQTISTSDSGSHWHNLRRGLQNNAIGPFSISAQVPLQESDMARMIKDVMDEASLNKGAVNPFPHIRRATIRLLARLCFGSNFSDKKFDATMDELCEDGMKLSDAARLIDAFPPTRFFPGVKHTILLRDKLRVQIPELIRPHLSSPPPPNCFAHFLLSQNFPLEVVIFSIFEVFFLGVDSTGSTTMWALALLVHNQEAQRKLYQEMRDKATLSEMGIVKVDEVGKLEYLQAVVKETMRMKPIAPLAVPHRAAKDTMLNGLHVAQGTTVIVNLYALHYDPMVWDMPDRFMPERFLVETSKEFQGSRGQYSFMPFGAGMRACAGMDVGKLQVAFTVANLVNAFQWSSAVEGEMPDLSEEHSFVLGMKTPFKARIVPRAI